MLCRKDTYQKTLLYYVEISIKGSMKTLSAVMIRNFLPGLANSLVSIFHNIIDLTLTYQEGPTVA